MGIHSASYKPASFVPHSYQSSPDPDRRIPCSLETRPSDDDAQAAGFADAQEWYAYSAGGALSDPKVASANFASLPGQLESPPQDMSPAQTYQFYKGQGEFFDTEESIDVAASTQYIICPPPYPYPSKFENYPGPIFHATE